MKLTISPYLDQSHNTSLLSTGEGRWNESIVGPSGLLNILEKHLGLSGIFEGHQLRIEKFRLALGEFPSGFFSRSFSVDPLSVSKTVLKMRDTLYLHGFDFKKVPKLPSRLADLCAVEKKVSLEAGVAERWRRVFESGSDFSFLDEVHILGNETELSYPMRMIVELLSKADIKVTWEKTSKTSSKGDLKKFIDIITNGKSNQVASGDGSLILLKGSQYEIDRYLSKYLKKNPATVLTADSSSLDESLTLEGVPSIGSSIASTNVQLFQLLKLIPELLFDPIDPSILVSLLKVNPSPISFEISKLICDQLLSYPGVGGDQFKSFISELTDEQRKECEFLFDRDKVERGQDLLSSNVVELYQYIAAWAGKKNKSVYMALSFAANLIVERLKVQSSDTISHTDLNRLVTDSIGEYSLELRKAEVGCPTTISHVGGLTENVDELIWHPFSSATSTKGESSAFYVEEINYLESVGIHLDGPPHLLDATIRALSKVDSKLILTINDDKHPLYSDLISGLKNPELLVMNVRDFLKSYRNVKTKGAPEELNSYDFDIGKIDITPKRVSYSALNNLIYHPIYWFLGKVARITDRGVVQIDEGNQLKGILTHHIFETMLRDQILEVKEAKKWFKDQYDSVVAGDFAPFMMQGLDSTRAEVKRHIEDAYLVFIKEISDAGWEVESVEDEKLGNFIKAELYGRVDCILKKGTERVIVDFKWGRSKYKVEEIEKGEALQLSVYKRLLGTKCHAAYFSIVDKCFVAENQVAFPNAIPGGKKSFPSNLTSNTTPPITDEEYWKKVEATYKERLEQMKKGKIEFVQDDDLLQVKKENRFSDYDVLMGKGK